MYKSPQNKKKRSKVKKNSLSCLKSRMKNRPKKKRRKNKSPRSLNKRRKTSDLQMNLD